MQQKKLLSYPIYSGMLCLQYSVCRGEMKLFSYPIYSSYFKYWSFSNKVFLKNKVPKKKKKKNYSACCVYTTVCVGKRYREILFHHHKLYIVELYPTPHFVPEGISSSMRDFIILVLILKYFIFSLFWKMTSFNKIYREMLPLCIQILGYPLHTEIKLENVWY